MDIGTFFSGLGDAAGGLASGGLSTIFGGLTGIVGGWMKNRHDREMANIQRERDKDNHAHELAVMDKEAEKAESLAKIQFEEKQFETDANALIESVHAEMAGATWSDKALGGAHQIVRSFIALLLGLVDTIRGTIRPGLTIYLIILVTIIWGDILRSLPNGLASIAEADRFDIVRQIVNMILYLTCTAVGWWFMTRPPKMPSSH